ncbi:MAG: hypothetical protein K6F82_05405 [Sphaerochaetaceae bacterium]|nr:hypothetical protein [Sphaerochaetaceae bacterium]
MAVLSIKFFSLVLLSLVFYYCGPKKLQWAVLPCTSLYFILINNTWYCQIFFFLQVLVTHRCACKVGLKNRIGEASNKDFTFGIIFNILVLALFKYSRFFIMNTLMVIGFFGVDYSLEMSVFEFSAPVGVSFYTLILVGYLCDVKWGKTTPQSSFIKTALLAGNYIHIMSGPFIRYEQVENQYFVAHHFDYKEFCFGLQRVLWGLFKKLVIAARLENSVDLVFNNSTYYNGLYIWLAAFTFMIQLYADFSGLMDIVIGIGECYGIHLPENFRTPFFSLSVQEYWQRWHISLGLFLKDYVLFPIQRSRLLNYISKKAKIAFGKKASRKISSYVGMLCVWLLIGIWHGGAWKYVIGMGIWFWTVIVAEQMIQPKVNAFLVAIHIDPMVFSWRLLKIIKTFVLVAIGNIFFRADSFKTALVIIKQGVSNLNPSATVYYWKLLGSKGDILIVFASCFLLLCVSLFTEIKGDVRIWLSKQILVFRWTVFLGLVFSIILFGVYGPGYNASEFVYRGF